MTTKNLYFVLVLAFANCFSTSIHCSKQQNKNNNLTDLAFSLYLLKNQDVALSLYLLKDLDAQDIEEIIENANTVTWDLVAPLLVAAYVFNMQPIKPKENKILAYTKGTTMALGAGISAYIIGSIPKQLLHNVIKQSVTLKKMLEDLLSYPKKK